MADQHLLRFGSASRSAALVDCPDLLRYLPSIFRGWRIEGGPAADPDGSPITPLVTLRREAGSYHLEAPWLSAPLRWDEAADGLCGFIAALIRARVMDDPELLCLHGAAVEIAGKLVVFPNRYRAGKSTLTACLAAAGLRVFADDVLLIGDAGRAAAMLAHRKGCATTTRGLGGPSNGVDNSTGQY